MIRLTANTMIMENVLLLILQTIKASRIHREAEQLNQEWVYF